MKRRLNQYSGELTAAKTAEGMNIALQNAKRLAADARLLFDNGRYASALGLSILSIEEAGKEPILRGLVLAIKEEDRKSGWRRYRTHTKKNVLWPMPGLVINKTCRLSDFAKLFDKDSDHPQLLDQLKQLSFYADCMNNCQWTVPENVIDRDLALQILQTAEVLAARDETKAEEIELWVQYMGGGRIRSGQAGQSALVEWDKEVRRRGLVRGKTTMEDFFSRGVTVSMKEPPRGK